jgi:hypothetical protein
MSSSAEQVEHSRVVILGSTIGLSGGRLRRRRGLPPVRLACSTKD